jgi:hypothetical protein
VNLKFLFSIPLRFIYKNQPMKTKFFLLIVLFLGITALTYAQTETAAPAEKKDAPAAITTDQAKTGECPGHATMEAKDECKWVDANGDGKCDTCSKTEKECKEACKHDAKAEPKKEGCGSSCPMHKECGKSTGTTPSK